MESSEALNEERAAPSMQPDDVATRAHAKWSARRQDRSELQDWLDAEAELQLADELRQQVVTLTECVARLNLQRQRTVQLLAAQHDVSRALAASLDLAIAAEPLLAAIARNLGWDLATLWLVDRRHDALRLAAVWPAPSARDAEPLETYRAGLVSASVDVPVRVLASGEPVWIADVIGTAGAVVPEQNGSSRLQTGVGIPLFNGAPCGVMEFFSRDARPADDELLRMMTDFGSQVGQFFERDRAEHQLRVQEVDRRLASHIQASLLPQAIPKLPGFAIRGRCCPANVIGGDCFDFISLDAGSEPVLGVLVADASGHGVAAALMAAEARAYLQGLSLACSDVGELVRLTNRRMTRGVTGDLLGFVTLFLARLDSGTRSLTYASAGHCPAQVLDSAGHVRAVLDSTGLPLGLDPQNVFTSPSSLIVLSPGDLVFVYSDGLTEAQSPDGELFGLQRALACVQTRHQACPDDILDELFRAVNDFSGEFPLRDDVTAVIIKVDSLPSAD